MSRADRVTPRRFTPEIVSDFDVTLTLNPITGDVSRVTNEAAVAQAIKLTLLTANGEWPFEPDNGAQTARAVFSPDDVVGIDLMRSTIETAFRNQCSGYAVLRDLRFSTSGDSRFVDVALTYSLLASPNVTAVARVVLKRAR